MKSGGWSGVKFSAFFVLIFAFSPAFVVLQSPETPRNSEFSEHGLGLLFRDPETTIPEHKLTYIAPLSPDLDVRTNTSLRSVINSAGLPPVRSQGSQGSCTAWATAYYHRTHLEWREKGWDVNLTAHQCSPAFLYHHINSGSDMGSFIDDAMEFMCTMGCASLLQFPYNENDATSWPASVQTYIDALQFRAHNYFYISTADDVGITNLKQHIANGGTAVIGIRVYENFDTISSYNNTYCVSEVNLFTYRGEHSVTVYGFDDDIETADGRGAFRLVNSWGTGWGDAGHFWMSYEAMKSATTCQRTAYFLTDRFNYTPSLLAEVKIQHGARGEIMWNGITAGIGNLSSPSFSLKILDFNSVQGLFPLISYQRHPFPDCNLVIDLSDGISYINRTGKNIIFVKVKDAYAGHTGTIQFLSATDFSWNLTNVSDETPVQIPDAGDYVHANVTLEPGITFEHTPTPVFLGEPVEISVHVLSIVPLSGVWLYYKPVNDTTWYGHWMHLSAGNSTDGHYNATIPLQNLTGRLEYYFYAEDAGGYTAVSQVYSTTVEEPVVESSTLFLLPLLTILLWALQRKGKLNNLETIP
ncbi:MAG: C1 family peptidase [Thermoplasmata archaeon]